MNHPMDTSLFDKAARFALEAHKNTERRGKGFPYAVHLMETVSIVATMTNDRELLAAAMLHDVIEDTDVTEEELRREFGDRITDLVIGESDPDLPDVPEENSWVARKEYVIRRLAKQPMDSKIVAMGDKLSNMRAIARDYEKMGDKLWDLFHAPDPKLHKWHYEGLLASLSDLEGMPPYEEFKELVHTTFSKAFPDDEK